MAEPSPDRDPAGRRVTASQRSTRWVDAAKRGEAAQSREGVTTPVVLTPVIEQNKNLFCSKMVASRCPRPSCFCFCIKRRRRRNTGRPYISAPARRLRRSRRGGAGLCNVTPSPHPLQAQQDTGGARAKPQTRRRRLKGACARKPTGGARRERAPPAACQSLKESHTPSKGASQIQTARPIGRHLRAARHATAGRRHPRPFSTAAQAHHGEAPATSTEKPRARRGGIFCRGARERTAGTLGGLSVGQARGRRTAGRRRQGGEPRRCAPVADASEQDGRPPPVGGEPRRCASDGTAAGRIASASKCMHLDACGCTCMRADASRCERMRARQAAGRILDIGTEFRQRDYGCALRVDEIRYLSQHTGQAIPQWRNGSFVRVAPNLP